MHYLIIPDFMKPEHCDEILAMARHQPSRFARSGGFDLNTGITTVSEHRTSSHFWFLIKETPLIALYEEKIAQMTGMPVEAGEGFQFAWYKPGEYFKSHHDYFHEGYDGSKIATDRGGQRIITFMIYLNPLPEGRGGETDFDRAGVKIRPEKGKAFVFWNVMPNWQLDDSTQHAGLAPAKGYEKFLLTKWIRSGRFT